DREQRARPMLRLLKRPRQVDLRDGLPLRREAVSPSLAQPNLGTVRRVRAPTTTTLTRRFAACVYERGLANQFSAAPRAHVSLASPELNGIPERGGSSPTNERCVYWSADSDSPQACRYRASSDPSYGRIPEVSFPPRCVRLLKRCPCSIAPLLSFRARL